MMVALAVLLALAIGAYFFPRPATAPGVPAATGQPSPAKTSVAGAVSADQAIAPHTVPPAQAAAAAGAADSVQRPAPNALAPAPAQALDQRQVALYYYNLARDRELGDHIPCSPDAVLPVNRWIPVTRTPIQDTIRLLLAGQLTAEERAAGFTTAFPLPEFRLADANVAGAELTLRFSDPSHASGGGSCRVRLLWAQIAKTAGQFPGVQAVHFSPGSLFQP